jgi:hypothetical protein
MNNQTHSTEASSELAEVLDRAMAGLPTRSRTAVVLRYLEGRGVAEVAATLGVSENAATKIILRGIAKLRRILGRDGPTLSLTPDALTIALANIAAKSSSIDLAHVASAVLVHCATPAANASALAHAAGKWMLWAKIQTTAAVLGTVLAISGVGIVVARQASLIAHSPSTFAAQPRLQFRLVEKLGAATTQPFTSMFNPDQTRRLRVDNQILMDESAVASAKTVPDQQGSGYAISIQLTPDGGELFSKITGNNIGRPLVILFDGRLLSAPIINSQINGSVYITGNFSKSKADAIVAALNANHPSSPATQTSSNLVIQDFDSTLGSMIELPVASSPDATKPAYTFMSLQRHRAMTPPADIHWNLSLPFWRQNDINNWLISNQVDLLIYSGGKNVQIYFINSSYTPAEQGPDTATTDSTKKSLASANWSNPSPINGQLPFNLYVHNATMHAIAQIGAGASNQHNIFRYRLMQLNPSKPTGHRHIFGALEFLYASAAETAGGSTIQLLTSGATPFNTRFPSITLADSGGLFLNGQLLAIGQFEVWTSNPEGNIWANFDIPIAQARAIADLINRTTPDNGYKRFMRAYSLNHQPLRYIAPPFMHERQIYTFWPNSVPLNTAMIFHRNDPKLPDYVENFSPTNGLATHRLADVIYSCCSLKKYEFFLSPELRSVTVPGDFIVDHSTTPQIRLAALQRIFAMQIGRPIKIEEEVRRCPVIVAVGHYDFTPLPQARHTDAVAFTSDLRHMDTFENGGSGGSWQELLDTLGDTIGVRMFSVVDNPPLHVNWFNYADIWDIYSMASQSVDQHALNTLLENLSAQTSLDFKIETRPEEVYVISPGP